MDRGLAAIGLHCPKFHSNVGGALRAAHAFGAKLVVTTGRRYKRAGTDTSAASRHLPLVHAEHLFDAIPRGAVPVCVERFPEPIEPAVYLPEFEHPEAAYYIFGPEDGAVPAEVVARCAHWVCIPSQISLNLATAVSVVLYDRLLKGRKRNGD